MPTRKVDTARPTTVPAELGGNGLLWNAEHTCIIAQAETLQQLWQATKERRIDDPIFEKVPLADVRFVGARSSFHTANTSASPCTHKTID